MYPPNQPKVPIRPRSSLSTDEHHRYKLPKRKNHSTTLLTLTGLCLFLFVISLCMLVALVYIGRSLVTAGGKNLSAGKFVEFGDNINNSVIFEVDEKNLQKNIKPKVVFRPNHVLHEPTDSDNSGGIVKSADFVPKKPAVSAEIMSMSKILNKISFRLPKEIQPKHYNLFLHPNLKDKTFSGNVTIQIEILKPISFIPIHSKLLQVTTTNVLKLVKNGEPAAVKPMLTFDHPSLEYWVTEFEKDLEVGQYSLQLQFHGNLTGRIVGLYQSSYYDSNTNETRWIATSKFEPTYARQAFPCFDEPAMKAPFKITLVRPNEEGYSALSNMDQVSEKPVGDNTEVTFRESVPMSTYLACFIVSDFKYKAKTIQTGGIGNNFDMRVFATPAQLDKVDFAMDTGVSITEYYIQYFKIEYPLPKLDMAAIPDFVSGAMEHWGLVTFRETSLLYDKAISSTVNKQRVATVVGHELAHMWFGNLVTMMWWNDLWLNEGFASYIEYKGVHHAHPDWKIMDQFVIEDMHGVLVLDATLASHPIVQTVENPDQITELFDAITYQKGCSVIRMLEDFVGLENFQKAVTNYLNRFKYSNAVTDDLLTEIEALGFDFDVKSILQTWTEQMGLPVVHISKLSDTEYKITQKRFLSNPENENKEFNDSPFNYRWSIPITYFTSDNETVERKWFNHNDAQEIIKLPKAVQWIKLNKNQVGYYRVNYDVEMWKSLTEALISNENLFSIPDRAHLLNDAFALADATQIPYNIALDLTRYLQNEQDFVPWSVASSKLLSLRSLLMYTDSYKDFLSYARNLVDKAYKEVGWEVDDNHLRNLLRIKILEVACSLGHPGCLEQVSKRFKEWLADSSKRPNPDIREIIYYHGMLTTGDEKYWLQVWDIFKKEQDASEKSKLMRGLSAIQVPWILSKYIDLAWDENNVRSQDYFSCLAYISQNAIGSSLVWDYVRENWQKLVDRFGLNERYLGQMIPSITGRFSTKIKLEEMENFFVKYPEAGAGESARKRALETVKNNIKWLEVNKEKVAGWLQNNK